MRLRVPLKLVGTSLAFNLVGNAINSEPLQNASQTTNKFISPAINISMGSYLIDQMQGLNKKKVLKVRR